MAILHGSAFSGVAAVLLIASSLCCIAPASADTVCTNKDYPGAGKTDVRSYRQAAVAALNEQIRAGEQAEGEGALPLAWRHFHAARRGFRHPDLGVWINARCAGEDDYRRALQHLQRVGGKLAQRDLDQGKYLWTAGDARQLVVEMDLENRQYLMLLGGGALEFNLRSFRYPEFQRIFEPYVAEQAGSAGTPERFSQLLLLVNAHASDLQQIVQEKEAQQTLAAQAATSGYDRRDDTIGLLPEEAAGYAVLKSTRDRLVKAIEDTIAWWLQQEEKAFAEVAAAEDMMSQIMAAEAAVDKLKAAKKYPPMIKSVGDYKEEPWFSRAAAYEQDILARAEQRGDRLMERDQSFAAAKYYSFAGARDKRDAAQALNREHGEAMKRRVEQSIEEGGKMFDASTEEERKQFDSETDALADELGL